MIEAEQFVGSAKAYGFDFYAGVPCSFLTPFINYVINNPDLTYISSANEGDAVATASGASLGGARAIAMMQNSGLGNAVSPLTSLNYVFKIPVLLICTHRGQPGVNDEPQHELMGQITGELFDTMRIPWATFPQEPSQIEPALQKAIDYMDDEKRPYAFVMSKGTVAPHTLVEREAENLHSSAANLEISPEPLSCIVSREQALRRIIEHTNNDNDVVIATTGFTGRELFAITDRNNQLYMVGSMGCASSLGLGLAKARPDLHVTVIDGDGASMMRMGNLTTVGAYGEGNLTHIILDNEAHDSTGAQHTVSRGVNFSAIAAACGYNATFSGNDLKTIDEVFAHKVSANHGVRFAHLKIRTGTIDNLPRPNIAPADVLHRLKEHIS